MSFLICSLTITAQQLTTQISNTDSSPTLILTPKSFHVSQAVRDMPVCDDLSTFDGFIVPKDGHNTSATMSDKRTRKLNHLKSAGKSSTQTDPLSSNSYQALHETQTRAPLTSFEGIGANVSPPDPSMAVGPNHIVTMENGVWAVYDKNGTIASSFPKPLNQPLSGPNHADNAGDPVVMYDREADRWFISQFQLSGSASLSDDVFLIGISVTPDPTGAYYVYEYELGAGNDYPHYGVWGDSYVTAGNFTGAQKVYTFNRTKMLAGDSSAEIAGFSPASLGASGFAAPIPVHSEAAGAATGAIKIVYYQDDAFSGVSSDHIGLWNIDMDWSDINSSSISGKIEIPTAAFDAAIAGGFANLQQPGTSQRIDAIVGAVMNMSHWYKFDTYESILLNWVVEITNGSQISGIRWVELRSTNNGGSWSVYQEGTFTDPTGNDSVFMGCIAMDKQGNIGLGYTKTGAATYPSLYYTGRMASDPLGTMTVAEDLVIAGSTVTTNDRYGDYGQGVRDPSDDLTFWVTSEYSGAPDKKVRVYSFKLGTDYDDDVAITAITNPVSGAGLSSTQTVTVTIANTGLNAQSNIPLQLSLDGTLVASEVFTGSISGGSSTSYSFTQTIDISTIGQDYTIETCTNLSGDQATSNDCLTANVSNLVGIDLTVTAIIDPQTNVGLTSTEDITFTLENIGGQDQSNIPISFTIDGGTPINANYSGPLNAGEVINLTLAGVADVSVTGAHTICVTINQLGDQDTSNDLFCVNLINMDCTGAATTSGSTACSSDGIKRFILGSIDVDDGGSGCNTENDAGIVGYANRTYLSTDLDRASGENTHLLQAQTNWGTQNLSAWIDFNDNGVFESTELLINQAYTIEDQLEDFDLVIPTNATLGAHILRLKSFDNSASGDPTNPCGDVAYGEIHDYTVNIIDSNYISWIGVANTSWNNTLNWSTGVIPTSSDIVVIDGTFNNEPSIASSTNATAKSVTVAAGNTLTIDETSSLTVSGDFTNSGTVTLNSTEDDFSSLIVTGTATGDITYNRFVNSYNDGFGGGWDLIGSPAGMTISAFIAANGEAGSDVIKVLGTNYAFSQYDNAIGDWVRYQTASQTGSFTTGQGYSMATVEVSPPPPGAAGTTVAFTGAMQTTDQSIDIINNTGLNGVGRRWNLVSNPYPSYINGNTAAGASNFIDTNLAVIDDNYGAVYGWNGSSYDIYNLLTGAFSIAPGQGFWVAALNTTDTALSFTANMRTTTGTGDFVSGPQLLTHHVAVKLFNGETQKATTDFYFRDGLSLGLDPGYDAAAFNQSTKLSSRLAMGSQETAFSINAMGMDAMQNTRVPLEIRQNAGQTFRVSMTDMDLPEDIYVYLEDTLNGTLTSLKDQDFELEAQSNLSGADRFFIVFKSNSVLSSGDTLGIDALNVYKANTDSFVTIAGITPDLQQLEVRLFSMLGVAVKQAQLNTTTATQTISTDGLASGLYMVQIKSGNQTIVKKIIVK